MIKFTGDKTQDTNSPLPDGDYFLTCTDAEEKQSSNGNDMIQMELTVAVGPYENRHFKYWLTFIPAGSNGHGITLHALHAFGLPYDGPVSIGQDDFKGKTVKAKVGSEPYQGRMNNKILDFYILSDEQISAEGSQAAEAAAGALESVAEKAPDAVPEPAKPAPQVTPAVKAVFGGAKPAPFKKKLPF